MTIFCFIISDLLKKTGANERTKLYQAVYDNDLPKVTPLVKEAKNLGIKEEMINIPNISGWTPLMEASWNNNLAIVKLLIQEGAIVSKINNIGILVIYLPLLRPSLYFLLYCTLTYHQ